MELTLLNKANLFLAEAEQAQRDFKSAFSKAKAAKEALDKTAYEQEVCVRALQALKDVRPLLAASSVEKAENLANYALQTIFLTSDKLAFIEEDQRFVIQTPEGDTDLLSGNGGGYIAVISFIFQIFLLMKSKSRPIHGYG